MADSSSSAATLIYELVDALEDLRQSAKDLGKISLRALKQVENGAGVADALRVVQPSDTRRTMNDVLKRVEEARHQIRLLVFAEGMRQGMSIAELGRQYGFSRQLAARIAKEARERFGKSIP
jgi:DNA-directed RNA polymerase sigma subunit (sigma70/sigma32)